MKGKRKMVAASVGGKRKKKKKSAPSPYCSWKGTELGGGGVSQGGQGKRGG